MSNKPNLKNMTFRQGVSNYIYAVKLMLKIYPVKFFKIMAFGIANTFLSFFSYTYMLRYIVNGLQEGRSAVQLLDYIFLIFILNIILDIFRQIDDCVITQIIDRKSETRLFRKIYKKSLEIDLASYENPAAFQLYNNAVSNAPRAISFAIFSISGAVTFILSTSLQAWLVFLIDPVLLIFVLIPVVINLFLPKVHKMTYEYSVSTQEINRKKDYTRRSFYQIEFAKEMRLTNIHHVMMKRFKDSIKEYLKLVRTKGLRITVLSFWAEFGISVIFIFGAEIYALYRTLVSGTIKYGDCLVILNSISAFSSMVLVIVTSVRTFCNTALYIQDYRKFMTDKPSVSPNPDGKEPTAGDIELYNVSFRYDGAQSDTLDNISLRIKKGERIAIVGHNGAGKTTLVKLLMRLYDPTDGEICVGGENIRNFKLREYRHTYSTVFQDYKQLSMTVAENVLGREYTTADETTVTDSLKKAGIWDIIEKQPKGIHTILTREFDENGLVLSGGQSQKLALAAVYARNADTVILDEPSSALDPLAEQEMYERMITASQGKTVIFISHRLSSSVNADNIFFMENGRITEYGNHAELMRINGKYSEMFRMQAQNYTDNINNGGIDNEHE